MHLEHQNARPKRMKCAGFSALAALSLMACRGRYGDTNFELKHIHALPFLDNHYRSYEQVLGTYHKQMHYCTLRTLLAKVRGQSFIEKP